MKCLPVKKCLQPLLWPKLLSLWTRALAHFLRGFARRTPRVFHSGWKLLLALLLMHLFQLQMEYSRQLQWLRHLLKTFKRSNGLLSQWERFASSNRPDPIWEFWNPRTLSRVEKEAHITVVVDQERVNCTPSSMTYPKIGRRQVGKYTCQCCSKCSCVCNLQESVPSLHHFPSGPFHK